MRTMPNNGEWQPPMRREEDGEVFFDAGPWLPKVEQSAYAREDVVDLYTIENLPFNWIIIKFKEPGEEDADEEA